MRLSIILSLASAGSAAASDFLSGIPTVPFTKSPSGGIFALKETRAIVVNSEYANSSDNRGTTLIPPTLHAFASTFAADLNSYLDRQHGAVGVGVDVGSMEEHDSKYIFLTIGNASDFLDAAGRETSEGYTLEVTATGVTITGASPLGVWWGTRSLLQQAALNNGQIPLGSGTDAPGWGIRGVMLDAGRHYYPASFLKEMCAYLSFYKQNTFHVHLSDNLYNNVDVYSREQQLDLYAAFRLLSSDPAVAGLNKRANESYTRDIFDDIQSECAARGVTIVPELEMPGHALVISQWKPELGIDTDISLLNITNPDTIPTGETIWNTFLPWFHSKTVHIGADEYVDASLTKDALVSEYNTFVNAINGFMASAANKSIRIWGTFPPSTNYTNNIATNVSIQHWEFYEDNPYFDYIKNGYDVLNSDDAFYIVNKYSGSYPQQLNITRVFHGAPDGGPYAPNIFDTSNSTNNPARDEPRVLGHIAALWNDYGPNATVYSEAYYAWRDGLPALADKQWGGELVEDEYYTIFDTLHAAIPGQNLDQTIASQSATILSYSFDHQPHLPTIQDTSGNNYNGKTNCRITSGALELTPTCSLTTPLSSKGRNYTLSFSIFPTSQKTPGVIFSGPESALLAGNGTVSNVTLIASGNPYTLNYTLPLNIWSQVSLSGQGDATFFKVQSDSSSAATEMQFLTKVGIDGETFVWREIAVEAPLAEIGGGEFEGLVKDVRLTG
ncbi:glycoside hydrolase superfamily [Talaromyces proteolyticus]|uniref:beta-N-acetylhexosaminidase n=1 Tax=Talaromyces proteolyticus TaxID=1131652 RepID=A0AAD4KIE2_9EURO|nr:glycoside hydrolase superfamily [Talaromyces proteolyticus]KAH8689153.1 glycoside hydrolase superfamily [Talaromyces proteolyticus]